MKPVEEGRSERQVPLGGGSGAGSVPGVLVVLPLVALLAAGLAICMTRRRRSLVAALAEPLGADPSPAPTVAGAIAERAGAPLAPAPRAASSRAGVPTAVRIVYTFVPPPGFTTARVRRVPAACAAVRAARAPAPAPVPMRVRVGPSRRRRRPVHGVRRTFAVTVPARSRL